MTCSQQRFVLSRTYSIGSQKCTHLSLFTQIRFVADQQHWIFVAIFNAQNLLLEFADFRETRGVRQREDEQKSLAGPHVLFAHGAELFLAGCVEDCCCWGKIMNPVGTEILFLYRALTVKAGWLVIDDALLGVGVLDGRVVVGHEKTLKLYSFLQIVTNVF